MLDLNQNASDKDDGNILSIKIGEDLEMKIDDKYRVVENKAWPSFTVDFAIECNLQCQQFVFYDNRTGNLVIKGSRLDDEDLYVGFYSIRVIAVFRAIGLDQLQNGDEELLQYQQTQTVKDKIRLQVLHSREVVGKIDQGQKEEDDKNIIKENSASPVDNSPDTKLQLSNVKNNEESSEQIQTDQSSINETGRRPIAFVSHLSQSGLLTMKWNNQEVLQQQTSKDLTTAQIMKSQNDKEFYSAIEISLLQDRENDQVIELDWKLINFDSEQIEIQVNLLNEFEKQVKPSFLRITFWNTSELYKNGVEQKDEAQSQIEQLGQTIFWPVLNIIQSDHEQIVSSIMAWLIAFLFILFMLTLPFYKLGVTMPGLRNFISTIIIFAHLPLLNAQLPCTIHALLVEILQFVRLDFLFSHGGAGLREHSLFATKGIESEIVDSLRVSCGYLTGYAEAVTQTLFIFLLFSATQVILENTNTKIQCNICAQLKDKCRLPSLIAKTLKTVKLSNVLLRVICIGFLIVAIAQIITVHDGHTFFAVQSVIMMMVFFGCCAYFLLYKNYIKEFIKHLKCTEINVKSSDLLAIIRNDKNLLDLALELQKEIAEENMRKRNKKNGVKNLQKSEATISPNNHLLTEKPLLTEIDNNEKSQYKAEMMQQQLDDYDEDIIQIPNTSMPAVNIAFINEDKNNAGAEQVEHLSSFEEDVAVLKRESKLLSIHKKTSEDQQSNKNSIASRFSFNNPPQTFRAATLQSTRKGDGHLQLSIGNQTFKASTINTKVGGVTDGIQTFRASTIKDTTNRNCNNNILSVNCGNDCILNDKDTFRASTFKDTEMGGGLTTKNSRNILSQPSPQSNNKSFIKFGSIKSPVDIIKAYQQSHTITQQKDQKSLMDKFVLPQTFGRLSSVSSIGTDELQNNDEKYEGGEPQQCDDKQTMPSISTSPQSPSLRSQSSSSLQRQQQQTNQRNSSRQFSPIMLSKSTKNKMRSKTLKPRQIEILISSAESPDKSKSQVKQQLKVGSTTMSLSQSMHDQLSEQKKKQRRKKKNKKTNSDQQNIVQYGLDVNVLKNHPRLLAKLRLMEEQERSMAIPAYYRTAVFQGLKLRKNTERDLLPQIYPLVNLWRCIMLIIAMNCYAQSPIQAVQFVIVVQFIVLAYQVHERVWIYNKINWQSTLNEGFLCAMASLMLVSSVNGEIVQPFMIVLISVFFSVNAFILTYIGMNSCIISYQKIYWKAKQLLKRIKKINFSDKFKNCFRWKNKTEKIQPTQSPPNFVPQQIQIPEEILKAPTNSSMLVSNTQQNEDHLKVPKNNGSTKRKKEKKGDGDDSSSLEIDSERSPPSTDNQNCGDADGLQIVEYEDDIVIATENAVNAQATTDKKKHSQDPMGVLNNRQTGTKNNRIVATAPADSSYGDLQLNFGLDQSMQTSIINYGSNQKQQHWRNNSIGKGDRIIQTQSSNECNQDEKRQENLKPYKKSSVAGTAAHSLSYRKCLVKDQNAYEESPPSKKLQKAENRMIIESLCQQQSPNNAVIQAASPLFSRNNYKQHGSDDLKDASPSCEQLQLQLKSVIQQTLKNLHNLKQLDQNREYQKQQQQQNNDIGDEMMFEEQQVLSIGAPQSNFVNSQNGTQVYYNLNYKLNSLNSMHNPSMSCPIGVPMGGPMPAPVRQMKENYNQDYDGTSARRITMKSKKSLTNPRTYEIQQNQNSNASQRLTSMGAVSQQHQAYFGSPLKQRIHNSISHNNTNRQNYENNALNSYDSVINSAANSIVGYNSNTYGGLQQSIPGLMHQQQQHHHLHHHNQPQNQQNNQQNRNGGILTLTNRIYR